MLPLVGTPSPAIVSSYKECGESCECDDCSIKNKSKGFVMDDVMIAKFSEMMDEKIASYSGNLEAEEYESSREAKIEELEGLLDEALELLDGIDDRQDSADLEGAIVFESLEEFGTTAAKLLSDYSQYRSDAAMVGVEVAGTDEEAIFAYVTSAQDMQRDILSKVAPDVRTDALEDESLEAAYQFAMTGLRKAHADRGTRNDMSEIEKLQLMGGIAQQQKQSAHRTIASTWHQRSNKLQEAK
jgi:hypothetical protein